MTLYKLIAYSAWSIKTAVFQFSSLPSDFAIRKNKCNVRLSNKPVLLFFVNIGNTFFKLMYLVVPDGNNQDP